MPEDLVRTVKQLRADREPYHLIAGGSNVIFPNRRFPGTVVVYRNTPKDDPLCLPQRRSASARGGWRIDAGASLRDLVNLSIKRGWRGLETLTGIPGTVGGAIVGNAGAYSAAISDCLRRVQVFDGWRIYWRSKTACRFNYRDSIFKHNSEIILRAEFVFKPGQSSRLAAVARQIITKRRQKYPPNLRCPGSFFKNVLVLEISRRALAKIDRAKIIAGKIPAGYLLAQVGACGKRVGDIMVANHHGNLLVNRGRGTYRDVRRLAATLKRLVWRRFGIRLEEEVRYIV